MFQMLSLFDCTHAAPASLRGPSSDGTIHLSPVAVALSAAALLANGFISLHFKLGLHSQLVFASIRMVLQLSLLGYILVPIFTYDKWWLVLLYGIFMLLIASVEAVQRPSYTFQGVLANTVVAMGASSGLLLTYLVAGVLALRPLWEAQYVIPLLGMLLGNATSTVSVGLAAVLEDLAANRAVVEHLLALGANRFEATDEAVRKAIKMSMTPLLNQMSVIGIVSIPGMMTGQILAGGDPTQAARYQMVIMFVIAAATCLASVASIYLAVLHVVDTTHTFRSDRLIKKQPKRGGAAATWADVVAAARRGAAAAQRKGAALGSCLAAACCCCCCLFPPPAPRRRGGGGAPRPSAGGGSAAATDPLLPPQSGDDTAAAAAVAASSPFAAVSSSRRWPAVAAAAAARLWPARRRAAPHPHPWPSADRHFSADSATSSQLLGPAAAADPLLEGAGGGGGVTSPWSARSVGAAGSSWGPAATPKLSWDDRFLEREDDDGGAAGAAYDEEEGNGASGAEPGRAAAAAAAEQSLLRPAPPAQSGWTGRSSSVVGSSVSAVMAVGGWLGSTTSAGLGAAWDAVGRWRSVGGTGTGALGTAGMKLEQGQAPGTGKGREG